MRAATSTDATNGIALDRGGLRECSVLTGGVTTTELIQMGTANTLGGDGLATLCFNSRSTLYLGSGVIVQNATLNGGSFTSVINLTSDTPLGAKASWTSSLNMTLGAKRLSRRLQRAQKYRAQRRAFRRWPNQNR